MKYIYTFMILFLYFILNENNLIKSIVLFIGNSFYGYHILPSKPILCSLEGYKYKCSYIKKKQMKIDATIYNGNRIFPRITNSSYNILMTIEKLSKVKFMKSTGEGKNKYYQLAVDYRLFSNRWHITHTYVTDIDRLIYLSNTNYLNIFSFMKRNDAIVYIQKKKYKNRQFIVKEIMKHYTVDSYGKDLNNKIWPINVSKENKIQILKKYKFCLAIENSVESWKEGERYVAASINDDYVTEKLFDCLTAGSIPIYFGPQTIDKFIPYNNSIINLKDFIDLKSLSYYLDRIKSNKDLLYSHLNWHKNYSKEWYKRFSLTYKFSYCKICNYVRKYT